MSHIEYYEFYLEQIASNYPTRNQKTSFLNSNSKKKSQEKKAWFSLFSAQDCGNNVKICRNKKRKEKVRF